MENVFYSLNITLTCLLATESRISRYIHEVTVLWFCTFTLSENMHGEGREFVAQDDDNMIINTTLW